METLVTTMETLVFTIETLVFTEVLNLQISLRCGICIHILLLSLFIFVSNACLYVPCGFCYFCHIAYTIDVSVCCYVMHF